MILFNLEEDGLYSALFPVHDAYQPAVSAHRTFQTLDDVVVGGYPKQEEGY